MTSGLPDRAGPELSGVVVHWRNEEQLQRLLSAWPRDPRFELVVVDNSQSLPELPTWVRRVDPEHNLGFAGGVNRGAAEARSAVILLLNPDVVPQPGALEAILSGLQEMPKAAGLAPRLWEAAASDGASRSLQFRWQLRPLPTPWTLLLQTLLIPAGQGPKDEPEAGEMIPQPAAAALAVRRDVLADLGGFDEGFYPAWFEDVDFAHRLSSTGLAFRYWPSAEFRHELGASVPGLGYGPFLWVYYRNLQRYLGKHHGRHWKLLATATLVAGMSLRFVLLPLVKPRRAGSRREAAQGLLSVACGALTAWRRPRILVEKLSTPPGGL